MFKKRKNVRKIVVVLMILIAILGVYIKNINYIKNKSTSTKEEYAAKLERAKADVGLDRGTINPVYRPKWEKVSSSFNATAKTLTVVVKGSAYESQSIDANTNINYASDVSSTLDAGDINLYVDGEKVTPTTATGVSGTIPKITVSEGTESTNSTSKKKDITYTITIANLDKAVTMAGKDYNEWSGNFAIQIAGRGKDSSTYNANVLTDQYGNQNMMEIEENGSWVNIEIKDTKTDHNEVNQMFADYIAPEIRYAYSSGNIDYTNKTLTVEFTVTDKYFSSTTLSAANAASNIKVTLLDTKAQIPDANITKTLTKVSDVTETRDGASVKIGEKYKLVVGGLEQKTVTGEYRDYSGPMSISIPAGVATDKSGNSNIAKTITIGVNEPSGSGNQQVVDVVDPVWKTENINIDKTNKKVTVDLVGTDKYYKSNSLTTDKIKVYIDGEEVKTTAKVKKSLSTATSVQYGVKYTLTLSDWEETTKQTGKSFFEWSGTTKIKITAGTLTDNYTNTSKEQEFELGHADFIQPKVELESSTKNASAKTETIVFNVIDKYLDTSKTLTKDDISVLVDGESATTITKTLNKTSDITETVNGKSKTIGHKYTLVLSNFERARTAINFNREYSDWSGTVKIKVAAGKVADTSGNTNTETTLTTLNGDKVDFVKPNVTYQFASSDINKTDKTFTMVFDMTDKYYDATKSTALSINDLTIKVDGKVPDWTKVTKTLRVEDRTNTVNGASKVIGKRYTLILSNLEQLQLKNGDNYLDYSGVITVAIPANKMSDETGNKNNASTITSGIEIKGEDGTGKTVTGTGTVVDVVDPLIEKQSASANSATKTATIKFKATDKYFKASTLTKDNIKVLVDGKEVTTGLTKTLTSSKKEEERTSNGTTSTVQYGLDYTFTVTGFTASAKQVKIVIPAGMVTDESGNGNKETTFILYNTLKATYTGTYADQESKTTAPFLGNSSIQRQNIDNITFQNSIPADVGYDETTQKYKNSTTWDVSAEQDKSILAWYTKNSNGSLKVYIGSDAEIFANQNSTDLFAYIGYATTCTSTETITNLNLLNVTGVTSMYRMFRSTGYRSMTKLDLGDTFDTSNATSMSAMFENTGYLAMTTLNLGEKFNTSKVTTMSYMFNNCGYTKLESLDLSNFNTSKVTNMSTMFRFAGYTAMTSINLGDNFDTSNVTTMSHMFYQTGRAKLTTLNLGEKFNTAKVTNMAGMFNWMGALTQLDLGDKFDTSNVTNMSSMFWGTGANAMTSFNLGDKFDTSKVTTMNSMFYDFGKKLETLDLGDKFYTTAVTDMTNMFYRAGDTSMTTIDLGPAFTKIADTHDNMFYNTGKSGTIKIQAPEQIYLDKNDFKLNTDETTSAINFTRGTINPKYRTEWIKEASAIDTTNKNITITLRGRTNGEAGTHFTSNVTSSLTADNVHVYFDGEEVTNITKSLATATTATNATTGANDVLQVLTLSNLVENARQSGKSFKEWSGNISLKIDKKTLKDDTYSNQNLQAIDTSGTMEDIVIKETPSISSNTTGKMFADYIKPEFTYKKEDTTVVHGEGEKVEITFDVTDKYFASTKLAGLDASQITVGIDDYDKTELNKAITKKLTKVKDITETVNGVANTKIGERYTLTITGLDPKDENGVGNGYKYSGYMTLAFAAGAVSDKSGNTSVATTITVGRDEPGGSTSDKDIIDVVDPVWSIQSVNQDDGIVKIRVSDKYLIKNKSVFNLTKEDIKILVNDKESTAIVKTLEGPVEITADQVYEYTLTLSNLAPADAGYIEFTPIDEIVGGTAKYKSENGGNISLQIAAGVAKDAYGNLTNQQVLTVGDIDATGPEVYDVQKTHDTTNNKEIFIFNITDKNYDDSKTVTTDELTVWLNDNQIDSKTGFTKKIVKTVAIRTTVDGKVKTVGHQYTLELSPIVETDAQFLATGRDYREMSGTFKVKIDPTAARDKRGNKINEKTTTLTDFSDTIKPEIRYQYTNSDIDYTGKTFTMAFNMVDKYYDSTKSTALNINDLTIKIDGKDVDWTKVNKTLQVSDKTSTVDGASKVIGKQYVLKLSNLEQLQVKQGDNYLDYSGVITVGIPANKMVDTAGNKNIAKTITSGIDIPGGSGDGTVVDVVDPLFEKESSSANAINKTATIKFKVTDKYFKASTLTKDNIKVFVNGTETTSGLTKTLATTDLKESNVKYGEEYTFTVTGFATNVNQVKIVIPQGVVTDNSGNGNKETTFILYNTLKATYTGTYSETNSESKTTASFLGNTSIQRQNIDNITFQNSIPADVGYDETTKKYKNSTAWDVSAIGDKSILSWYTTNANGSLKVYIGSDSEIFANQISRDLFAYIGYSDKCTSTETITNINLLNVASVTDMYRMFRYTGYKSMTKLDLGDNFDTSNVTNMSALFEGAGYTAMTTLNLGDKFNTSKVTNISYMFSTCGYIKLESLDLLNKFDTSNVEHMRYTFYKLGYIAMKTLNLGTNFNTSNVINMEYMFAYTGYRAMTSLDLGKKFNTSKVTNMAYMFRDAGHDVMTTLKLGDNFDTSKVTTMEDMFYEAGQQSLTSLDLGTKFDTSNVTNMYEMFAGLGSLKMTTFNLGDKFDTSKVTNMNYMFHCMGYNLTTLDLGDKFYTTNVTNMEFMFNQCGTNMMTTLDLGPAFAKISADKYGNMFNGTGKSGALTIYASEQIYLDKNNFKLNTDATTSAINYTRGTINPKYRT